MTAGTLGGAYKIAADKARAWYYAAVLSGPGPLANQGRYGNTARTHRRLHA
jgi:hypothetical protein